MRGTLTELAKKNNMSIADYARYCMGGSVKGYAPGGIVDDMNIDGEDPNSLSAKLKAAQAKELSDYAIKNPNSLINKTNYKIPTYNDIVNPDNKTGVASEWLNKIMNPNSSQSSYPSVLGSNLPKKAATPSNKTFKKVPSLEEQLKFNAPVVDPNNPEGNDVTVPETMKRNNTNNPPNQDYTKPAEQNNPQYTQGGNGQPTNGKTTDKSGTPIDLGSTLGIGQGALGAYLLAKNKRPIDALTPEFQSQLAASIAQSKYGYTPEQKALLNEQLIENRNAALGNVYNAAGGNGSVALNNARQVFNDSYKNRLENASSDEMLRLQKMGQANNMASTGEQFHRALFGDKMNQYNQNISAGAQLLGAGIENLIGSQRYGQSRLASQQLDKYTQ